MRLIASLVVFACLATATEAQVLTRITPQAAAPGDIVIIDGTGLGGTSTVLFTAYVGGFAGLLTYESTPFSVTPTEVRCLVPVGGGWVPSGPPLGSSPFGTVTAHGALNSLDFFFMQAPVCGDSDALCGPPGGAVDTYGIGTTQPNGEGRAVVSFVISKLWPFPGNAGFEITLENGTPGAMAFLGIGLATPPPFPLIGDGTLVLDLTGPLILRGAFLVDPAGDASLHIPVPTGIGVELFAQWGQIDPVTLGLTVTNAMSMEL